MPTYVREDWKSMSTTHDLFGNEKSWWDIESTVCGSSANKERQLVKMLQEQRYHTYDERWAVDNTEYKWGV